MADFTDQDKETLEKLRKAFESKALTDGVRRPWQEPFARETSTSTAAILGADLVAGFSGSWASSYNYGFGAGITTTEDLPSEEIVAPIRAKRTKLGERGVPDIDFVPYNWRTNRFGSKGPALVGHPISFRVVGPTLKSPFCDWVWEVQEGAGPNGGDILIMDTTPTGGAPVATTIAEGYNIAVYTVGDAAEPNGGLYVLIADDGSNPGSLPGGATAMPALDDFVDTARYELFRVSEVRASQIELHPSKPLSTYFDLPAASTRAVRAITFLQPHVTRLAAVPGSGAGVGRERTFVVISPETAASSDTYPPYNGGVLGDGSWLQGGFEQTNALGDSLAYGGASSLPIPLPLREAEGIVEKDALASVALAGQFIVEDVTSPSVADIGRVLRIYHIDHDEDAVLTIGTDAQALGWFAIRNVVGSTYTLTRVAEVSPSNGEVFFGPGPFFINAGDPVQRVYFTIHDTVRSLWSGPFSLDRVDSVRLSNLIDPTHVQRAEKKLSDVVASPVPGGSSAARADKAIFDTRLNTAPVFPIAANPGSLLDLGFRMVLFPARDVGGNPVPDFNRPIVSREVVIDSLVQENQYLDIDYSSGIVRLSHSPPTLAGGSIIPAGIISGALNPRGEVVLFAACVPYSMEPSQMGPGVRATGGIDGAQDLYSERVVARIDIAATVFTGAAPYFGAAGIVLDRVWAGPPTGVIDILAGDVGVSGLGPPSYGTWAYSSVDNSGATSVLLLISSDATVGDPTAAGNEQRTVVLRRDVFFGTQSANNSLFVDDVRFDTVYGSSHRTGTLRFPGATLRPLLDGSTEVRVDMGATQLAFSSYQWGYWTASGLPAANALANKFYSENGCIEPLVYQDNANPVSGAVGGLYAVESAQGPRIRIASLLNANDYKGVMCEAVNNGAGVVAIDAYTRFVTKFEINAFGEDFIFFAGLVGSTGATDPSCSIVTAVAAPPADIRQVGLRVYSPLSGEMRFFGLGTSAGSVPTGLDADGTGVYHFVMETLPGPEVRFGLFDADFNLLVQAAITDSTLLPLGTTGLYPIVAIMKTSAGAPRVNLETWFTHVMTRYDTSGPPLLSP